MMWAGSYARRGLRWVRSRNLCALITAGIQKQPSVPNLFFKAGQECFEEGVGNQIDDGLPRARAGILRGA